MSNDITITSQPGATVGTAAAIFSPEGMNQLVRFATLMADSRVTVPAHLAGKPADCLAVAMQAAQWGMNPFAVAQKTHVINGALGYEAQLVNAAITAMAPTKDRVHFEWFGPWENVIGKFKEKTSEKGKKYLSPDWTLNDEKGCGVKVWATLKGENEPRVLELLLTQAQVRNSTLWGSDPKQQLAYLGVKRWARLYCPEVILGVYTPDEVEVRTEREINPSERPARATISDMAATKQEPAAHDKAIEGELETKDGLGEKLEADFLKKIDAAVDCEVAAAIRSEIEEKKNDLGRSRYTALKGKAISKYHHIDARNAVEAAINSLDAGSEFAANDFARTEQLLNSRKNHLGPDLYEKFMINMNDMRPEFEQ